jgi:hypothetical protein
MKEVAVKAKHKTKAHILSLFRSGGKKAAGVNGDVSVDGRGKRVSFSLQAVIRLTSRLVPRLTGCCSRVTSRMMARLDASHH